MNKTGNTLLGLGGFLVTVGVLSPTWVYDQVAVIPAAADMRVVATTSEPADFFDLATLTSKRTQLQQTVIIRGDTEKAAEVSRELGRDVVVWQVYTCTDRVGVDCPANPLPLAATNAVTAFDEHTAVSVPWKNSYVETEGRRTPNPPAGYSSIKFPFATTRSAQEMWDGDLQESLPMQYAGTTTYRGLDLYAFDQTIESTKVGTMDVPGSLVGSDEATVTVDRMYANHREYTVEPVTGVIIGRQESPDSYLAIDGRRVLTLVRGTFAVDEQTMADTAKDYRTLSFELRLIRTLIPAIAVPVGVFSLLVGAFLHLRRRSRRTSTPVSSSASSPTQPTAREVETHVH